MDIDKAENELRLLIEVAKQSLLLDLRDDIKDNIKLGMCKNCTY